MRIACAYRGGARAGGFDDRIGCEYLSVAEQRESGKRVNGGLTLQPWPTVFQAACVPLVLILGGTTITNVLMGAVPGWLISPIPVATYG